MAFLIVDFGIANLHDSSIALVKVLNSSNFFELSVLSRENHLLSDLEIWHSGSLHLCLEK